MVRSTLLSLLISLTLVTPLFAAEGADRQQALVTVLTSNAPMPEKAAACREPKLAGDQ